MLTIYYSLFFRKNYAMLGAVFAGAFAWEMYVTPRAANIDFALGGDNCAKTATQGF